MDQPTSDRDRILQISWGFQAACVLGTAAEFDLFTRLGGGEMTADELAEDARAYPRALAMLADAVAALGMLDKRDGRYRVPEHLEPLLRSDSAESTVPYLRHLMNVARGWAMLGWTVKAGMPAPRPPSILGAAADRASFVAAMHSLSLSIADGVIARLDPPKFERLLDVGGASGTWTIALLRAVPGARATIFDLPDAIDQARERFAESEFADRIDFAPGDFYRDELPGGADFAWLGAIIHQHSRRHNRELFAKVFRALKPGGRIAVRDVVMDADRTRPKFGALFAINMLVNTETGGTFTFDEIAEDLQEAGFTEPELVVEAEDMNSVVMARKRSTSKAGTTRSSATNWK